MEDSENRPSPRRKENYVRRRERDVLLLYGAAFRNIPHIDNVDHHKPRPSSDSTLTALCQLTAIRLGAQRCMITLLGKHRQHILAEATPNIDLRTPPDSHQSASSPLWLGNVSIPRSWGLLEQVVDSISGEDPILTINDLTRGSHMHFQKNVPVNSHVRFYASVGLVSPKGTIVGSLCIFDCKSRDGLSKYDAHLLKGLAATVVGYLDTYTTKDQYERAERFTRGLVSFAEGESGLLPFKNGNDGDTSNARPFPTDKPPTPLGPATTYESPPSIAESERAAVGAEYSSELGHDLPAHSVPPRPNMNCAGSSQHQSISKLQETILPHESKSMFARAAQLMMNFSNFDGVLILDASVVANDQQSTQGESEDKLAASSESCPSRLSSSDDSGPEFSNSEQRSQYLSSSKTCEVLGVATSTPGVCGAYGFLLEPELGLLFHEYPHGTIYTFTADGQSLSSTEESSEMRGTTGSKSRPGATTTRQPSFQPQFGSDIVRKMFPEGRSVAFIPLWDYERSRWFAGCLCWSNDPCRLLSASTDLAYFKIFSDSVMRELSRLDAISMSEAKTTFVASISHELRSPLHGILGTLEFMKDTPLDSFQTSMMNSLNACGSTLLDTINHVMDFSKLTSSDSRQNSSSRRLQNSNTIRLSSKSIRRSQTADTAFDFSIATEEVVEAVFSGASYLPVASRLMEAPPITLNAPLGSKLSCKICFIIIDIPYMEDWIYCFDVGSWRRVVMNLFGNAIKYTQSGFIHVSLRPNRTAGDADAATTMILTITDTGSGMSPAFLANRAFQPFSQENPHAPGTGLGLNIVRTIIDYSGGKIEISSESTIGTKLTVKLSLSRPLSPNVRTPESAQYHSSLPRLEGRRACILHRNIQTSSDKISMSSTEEGLLRFTNTLVKTLREHLKMEVTETTDWRENNADVVICPELSFDYLDFIRRRRTGGENAPVTIFVAMDAMEAFTLRSDARVKNKESVVEIMTQPCGPRKLAFVINQSLDRYERRDENIQHKHSTEPVIQRHGNEVAPSPEPSVVQKSLHNTVPSSLIPPAPLVPDQNQTPVESDMADRVTASCNENATPGSYILITDDNILNRKLLVAFMRKNNLLYEEATNGLGALKVYQKDNRKFGVVLMDMSMPLMDGMSASRAIREFEGANKLPRCLIIALTGLASASAKLEAWGSGIDHFMTKPVNFKTLATLLREKSNVIQEQRTETGKMDVDSRQQVPSPDSDGKGLIA